MIERLIVENFKVFGDAQAIPLAPITLIFGGNSAGKSSLIQALLLARQSVVSERRSSMPRDAELVIRGELVDLGSFDALIHRHERDRPLTIGWTARRDSPSSRPMGMKARQAPDTGTVTLTFDRPPHARKIAHSASSIGVEGELVKFRPLAERRQVTGAELYDTERSRGELLTASHDDTLRMLSLVSSLYPDGIPAEHPVPSPSGTQHFPISEVEEEFRTLGAEIVAIGQSGVPAQVLRAETYLGDFNVRGWSTNQPDSLVQANRCFAAGVQALDRWMGGVSRLAQSSMAALSYLGPMRKAAGRLHVLTGEIVDGAGTQGEFVVDLLARQSWLLAEVNRWLDRLNIPYALDIVPVSDRAVASAIGEVHCLLLTDQRTGVQVAPTDVGFGIGQVLPVIVQSVLGRGTLCIEQPEIHLHPRLQAELAELFAERAKASGLRHRQQFVLETHSEHLILRLQRLVRREVLRPEELSVLHVGTSEAGQSVVRQLRLDESGEFIDEWPGGFFDERFDELFFE